MAAHLGRRRRPRGECARPHMVRSRPASERRGLRRAADPLDRVEQLRQPLERVVLALDRDEDAVGGRERVHGQRAERRRAVEEDEGVVLARGRERRRRGRSRRRRAEPSSTAVPARSRFDGHEVEVLEPRRAGRARPARRRRGGRPWRFRSRARRGPRWRSPAGRDRRRACARRPRRGRRRGSPRWSSSRPRPSGSRARRSVRPCAGGYSGERTFPRHAGAAREPLRRRSELLDDEQPAALRAGHGERPARGVRRPPPAAASDLLLVGLAA